MKILPAKRWYRAAACETFFRHRDELRGKRVFDLCVDHYKPRIVRFQDISMEGA